MEETTTNNSFGKEVLERIVLEIVGFTVFLFLFVAWMQLQNPGSWLSLKIRDAEGYVQEKKRKMAELQMRQQVKREIRAMESAPMEPLADGPPE